MKITTSPAVLALVVLLSVAVATGPAARQVSAEPVGPGFAGQSARVVMVALPWDDPSMRVPPPSPVSAMSEPTSTSFQISYLPAGAPDGWGATCLAWPTQAQTAFAYAASIWAGLIDSNVPVKISACWANLGGTNILGYSSSYLTGLTIAGVTSLYNYSLANALTGQDLDPGYPDSAITYNSQFQWYFGTDMNVPSGMYDLVSVALHEMAHSLSFSGTMGYGAYCGGTANGCWGLGSNYPGIYDRFGKNGSGQSLTDQTLFPNRSAALGAQLTGNALYFDGPHANAANGGHPVRIFAPAPWINGSSYSHLDWNTFWNTPNRLMVWQIPARAAIHDPGAVTMGILDDLGWRVPGNPPLPPQVVATADGSKLTLRWPYSSDTTYRLWRSLRPYFLPGETGASEPAATCTHDAATMTCTVTNAIGNPAANYTYLVRAVNGSGQSSDSNRTGVFGFGLTRP